MPNAPLDDLVLPFIVDNDPGRKVIHITPTVKYCLVAGKMGITLGNQYYTEAAIQFYLLKGEVEFKIEDIFTQERKTRILFPNQGLILKPYTAMKLLPQPFSQFLMIFGREYNPQAYHNYEITW